MSFSRPIQWYHSHADPIWPDGTFNLTNQRINKRDLPESGSGLALNCTGRGTTVRQCEGQIVHIPVIKPSTPVK